MGKQDDEQAKYFRTGPLTYEGNVYFTIVRFDNISCRYVFVWNIPTLISGAIYLATRGSAKVCSLDHVNGSFDAGKKFDALRIKMNNGREETTLFGYESIKDMIQKFVFVGDDRNITQVYVNGKLVKDASNNNNSDNNIRQNAWNTDSK